MHNAASIHNAFIDLNSINSLLYNKPYDTQQMRFCTDLFAIANSLYVCNIAIWSSYSRLYIVVHSIITWLNDYMSMLSKFYEHRRMYENSISVDGDASKHANE